MHSNKDSCTPTRIHPNKTSPTLQVHLLVQGDRGTYQTQWPGFEWTQGNGLVQACDVTLQDVGRISAVEVIVSSQVRSASTLLRSRALPSVHR